MAQKRLNKQMISAFESGDLDAVKAAIEKGADINAKDGNRMTLLHHATKEGETDHMRWLLKNRAYPDCTDGNMWTPLHYAAMDGDIETMQVLLEFGANRKAGDGNKFTPMYYAEKEGHTQAVQLLKDGSVTSKLYEPPPKPPTAQQEKQINIQRILKKKPEKVDLLNQLASIKAKWSELGEGLCVDDGDIESIRQSTLRDEGKLSAVLQKWMDTMKTPVTWEKIIEVVQGPLVQKAVVAAQIRSFLSQESTFEKYLNI